MNSVNISTFVQYVSIGMYIDQVFSPPFFCVCVGFLYLLYTFRSWFQSQLSAKIVSIFAAHLLAIEVVTFKSSGRSFHYCTPIATSSNLPISFNFSTGAVVASPHKQRTLLDTLYLFPPLFPCILYGVLAGTTVPRIDFLCLSLPFFFAARAMAKSRSLPAFAIFLPVFPGIGTHQRRPAKSLWIFRTPLLLKAYSPLKLFTYHRSHGTRQYALDGSLAPTPPY